MPVRTGWGPPEAPRASAGRGPRRSHALCEGYQMKTAKRTASEGRRGRGRTGKRSTRRYVDKAALVEQVIQSIEERLRRDELKATVGDLIRLVQLEKELEDERPKEIKVTWIEPEESDL